MSTQRFSARTNQRFRIAILVLAPAVAVLGHGYHPWIGSPGDPDFFDRLAAAVAADPTRWAVAHLTVAIGSGLLILALLALRGWLREAGEDRWSALGLPFIVMGSLLYALLPGMEFAAIAAHATGGDVAAVQPALQPWFMPILVSAAALFAVGVLGFVVGIARSGAAGRAVTGVSIAGLVVTAGSRFVPVGAALLYVGPVASLIALWALAYAVSRGNARSAAPGFAPEPASLHMRA